MEEFLWGAATSGHQVEGGNENSDWWHWENEGRCEGGARSGAATDHWNRFREDLRLAADLGLTSYRFSIEWSRIEPAPGRWDFRRMLRFAHRYRLPIYVTENGIADREDRLRPAYLKSHLFEIREAIREGIPVRGYYHWSLLDNFEWIKGFGPRFGLFRVDYETFERTRTDSARIYAELILQAAKPDKVGKPG